MRCHRARKSLSAHLDGELEPRRQASLRSHLAGCEACAAELARLTEQWDALAEGDPAPPLPPSVWPRILAALDEADRQPWHRRHRVRLVQAACVAACVLLGLAGGAHLSWREPPAESPPATICMGEQSMVSEAFDVVAFGLNEGKEGLFPCVPR